MPTAADDDPPIFRELMLIRERRRQNADADGITVTPQPPKCWCIANQKGGVGKTTITVNTAYEAAWYYGLRVVVIDTDPQTNATKSFSAKPAELGTYHLFDDDEADVFQTVQATPNPNIWVIPAHGKIKLLDAQLAVVDGSQTNNTGVERPWEILAMHVERLKASGWFDLILVDTPGSLALMTTSALYAADSIISPFTAGFYELEGIAQLVAHLKYVAALRPEYERTHGRKFGVTHAIMAAAGRANIDRDTAEAVRRAFPNGYIDQKIPRSAAVGVAQSGFQSVVDWDPRSKASIATKKVVATIMKREGYLRD